MQPSSNVHLCHWRVLQDQLSVHEWRVNIHQPSRHREPKFPPQWTVPGGGQHHVLWLQILLKILKSGHTLELHEHENFRSCKKNCHNGKDMIKESILSKKMFETKKKGISSNVLLELVEIHSKSFYVIWSSSDNIGFCKWWHNTYCSHFVNIVCSCVALCMTALEWQ